MMNGEKETTANGEWRLSQVDTGTENFVSDVILPHFEGQRNPQTIPTAAAGVVNWAVCDALATLSRELIERGLIEDNDELTEAIGASWQTMVSQASYFPPSELQALEDALEVAHA